MILRCYDASFRAAGYAARELLRRAPHARAPPLRAVMLRRDADTCHADMRYVCQMRSYAICYAMARDALRRRYAITGVVLPSASV